MKSTIRVIWLLSLNILRVSFRKKATLITFFILPVLGMLLSVGVYSRLGPGVSRIGVVDRDHSVLSRDLYQSLRNNRQFEVAPMNAAAVNNGIVAGSLDCAVVIPSGFAASVLHNRLQKIRIISLKGDAGSAWIKSYIDTLLRNLKDIGAAAGGRRTVFAQIYHAYRLEKIPVNIVKVADLSQSKGMTTQSIGFLILFMLVGVGNSVEIILKEKRDRTYQRICAAPVSGRAYILGNVTANLIVVMLQVLLALLVMTQVFRFTTYVPFWQLYFILVLFGLAAIGLGLLIVAFSGDTTQAGILQNLLIVPSCFLAGCFWPLEIMPRSLRRIGEFMPQQWAIAAIQKLQEGAGLSRITLHITVILAFALTFFLVAAYLFGRKDDMKTFV